MNDDELHAIMRKARADCDALSDASAEEILATSWAWAVRHGDAYSITWMDEEELRQSVVEDLLSAEQWRRSGKGVVLTRETLARHVPEGMRARVLDALDDPFVRSLIRCEEEGRLTIHPHHLQDAMDFCGVWLEGHDALTGETVYRAGRLPGQELD